MADDERMQAEVARLRRLEGFRRDPLGFVRWAFPWEEAEGPLAAHKGPEKWQADVLDSIGEGLRAEKGPVRIAVASGHGVGKSALVAWLILWALATQTSTRGVVTANTETQLKTKTWAELGKWHRLALSHQWCQLGATALTSAVPETEQGGRIDIRAQREGQSLLLQVQDSGVGLSASMPPGNPANSGFGLGQVRDRLQASYGPLASLTVADAPGGGTLATVTIPLAA